MYIFALCLHTESLYTRKESRNLDLLVCKNNNAVDIAFPLRLGSSSVSFHFALR